MVLDTVVTGRSNQGMSSNYAVGTVILQDIQWRVAIKTLFKIGMELVYTLSVIAPLSEALTIRIFRPHTKHFSFVFIRLVCYPAALSILTKQMTLRHSTRHGCSSFKKSV
jgi:hypothetical protein